MLIDHPKDAHCSSAIPVICSPNIPRMVAHQPQKESPPQSPEWSPSIPWIVTHHPEYGHGHPPSKGCIPKILRMVTRHHKDAHPPSQRCSPTIPRMLTHHPQDAHPSSPGCSPTIPKMATNYSVIHSPSHTPETQW